jgi:hypothetical protein
VVGDERLRHRVGAAAHRAVLRAALADDPDVALPGTGSRPTRSRCCAARSPATPPRTSPRWRRVPTSRAPSAAGAVRRARRRGRLARSAARRSDHASGLGPAPGDAWGTGGAAPAAHSALGNAPGVREGLGSAPDSIGSAHEGMGEAPPGRASASRPRGHAEVRHLAPPDGYHNKVDADGDGTWDKATYRGRAERRRRHPGRPQPRRNGRLHRPRPRPGQPGRLGRLRQGPRRLLREADVRRRQRRMARPVRTPRRES